MSAWRWQASFCWRLPRTSRVDPRQGGRGRVAFGSRWMSCLRDRISINGRPSLLTQSLVRCVDGLSRQSKAAAHPTGLVSENRNELEDLTVNVRQG